MPLMDPKGRLFGTVNLFDLFLVMIVAAVVVIAYQRLTVDYRVAPPYALDAQQVTVAVDLQLPKENAWLCDAIAPGLQEIDPRSGEARATVVQAAVVEGIPLVSLRISAVRDGSDRILFKGSPLLPGRSLRLEMTTHLVEGVVRSAVPETIP